MKRFVIPAGIFVVLMAVYFWTMAPGSFWIDSAAFAACNYILGLPHSPSFPLYTVLGRTVDLLLPADPARAANIFSALAAALGAVFFYLILETLLVPIKLSTGLKKLAAIAGTFYAFLTVPIWQSAVRAEVYSLQILLSVLVIYLFIKAVNDTDANRQLKLALASVFFQGLSFANHSLLALITLPLIISLPFMASPAINGFNKVKLAGAAVLIFALAVSFYIYLPLRSNRNPAINSGRPQTIGATFRAVTRTGESYLPTAPAVRINYLKRVGKMLGFLYEQTGGLALLGFITALVVFIRRRHKALLMLAILIPLGFAATIWAADFQPLNFDIVAYSGLPLILLIMMAFYGLSYLAQKAFQRTGIGRLVPLVFILMVFFQLSGNLYASDLAGTAGPDRTAYIILEEAPPNAILLLNEDNVVLPLWYHCLALRKRPDLAVISAGALYRPTYRDEVRYLYPNLNYPPEFDDYRIRDLGRAMQSFCRLNEEVRPIMVQFGVPGIGAADLLPSGFLFRYGRNENADESDRKYPSPALLDYIADGATDLLTKDFVARTAFNYGVYFDRLGQSESAYRFFEYAIETDDGNPDYLLRLGVAFLKAGQRDKAILLLEEAAKTGAGCPEAERLLKQINDRKFGKL